jgi:rare lipoprotein A
MKIIVVLSFLYMFYIQNDIVKVSYYGKKFHGKTTASGESFNMYGFTTAHKKLPFGTMVEITNISNNKSVVVKVNDRGPYIKGRVFDLSKAAFDSIGDINKGVIKVKYKIIKNEK